MSKKCSFQLKKDVFECLMVLLIDSNPNLDIVMQIFFYIVHFVL